MTKKHHFPVLTLGLGGIGLALRFWLYANRDELNLLPAGHISSYLTLALTVLTLVLIFITARRYDSNTAICPPSPVFSGLGNIFFAIGIILCSLSEYMGQPNGLPRAILPIGIVTGIALITSAILRFLNKPEPFAPYCIVTVYLVLHAISQCRAWGSEPQLNSYCFHLLCAICLMLTGYHRTAQTIQKSNYRYYLLFSQAAVFFCCLVLNAHNRLFYMAALLWLILDAPKLQEA